MAACGQPLNAVGSADVSYPRRCSTGKLQSSYASTDGKRTHDVRKQSARLPLADSGCCCMSRRVRPPSAQHWRCPAPALRGNVGWAGGRGGSRQQRCVPAGSVKTQSSRWGFPQRERPGRWRTPAAPSPGPLPTPPCGALRGRRRRRRLQAARQAGAVGRIAVLGLGFRVPASAASVPPGESLLCRRSSSVT